MEANELMIGIFVYFYCFDGSKIIVRVTGFKDGIVYGDSKNGQHWCNIEKVEPIPITPEILEKNGWEERPKGYVLYKKLCKNTFVVNTADIQIKYVHELQHALRLCEIEKEIIL